MNEFISYIKANYRALIISGVVIMWLFGADQRPFLILIIFFNILTGYNHYRKEIDFNSRLKAKGLTREDAANIVFVKKWEVTRQAGLWKYCIIDGGIICGAGLSLLTSVISLIFLKTPFAQLFAEPGDMFKFIGYNYTAGIVFGVVLFRFKWAYNEKRFFVLIDPLNFQFSSVRDLL